MTALVDDLARALAPDRVRVGAAELSLYRRDASNFDGRASVVCFPLTAAEVQSAVRICARHATPFVARGSGTGLAGGATPLDGAVVISLAKMNRILSIDAESRQAWVEPGVLNLDLTRAVQHVDLHFAPDPS
ncbi:MAG TPA: FAD-binding oxidoreductase, partial [Ilumatobacteraceae bacterium]